MPKTPPFPSVAPHLIVKDAPRAIAFYVEALGAKEESRFVDHKLGVVVHAELSIGETRFTLSEENREYHNDAPTSLGGSPVVLVLRVESSVDALGEKMVALGAEVVFPIADQFYGEREGRLRDPFGHVWRVGQRIKEMTAGEIQAGVDAYHDEKT